MKKTKFVLALFCYSILFKISYAQDNPRIVDLYSKVAQLEGNQSDTTKVVFRKGCTGRKYNVKTKIESDSLLYRHKIKYFRSGAKRESIKHFKRSPNNKVLILEVVKINALPTYIKYCETGINIKREISIVREEVLIDNKYYQMRTFDRYGLMTETVNMKVSRKDN